MYGQTLYVYNGGTNATSLANYGASVLVFPPGDSQVPLSSSVVSALNSSGWVVSSVGVIDTNSDWDLVVDQSGVAYVSSRQIGDFGRYQADFLSGLEAGGVLSAVLFGFIVVRRALSLGDRWGD